MVAESPNRQQVIDWLAQVPDPEIPVLSITDLGIVRDVAVDEAVTVSLAPTYSGCPATEAIETTVVETLKRRGIDEVKIRRVLAPPWTTDWISDEGRDKLRTYGIAPPEKGAGKAALLHGERSIARSIACPRCGSIDTTLVSEFGSTACKASYRCEACREPFEYFKCI